MFANGVAIDEEGDLDQADGRHPTAVRGMLSMGVRPLPLMLANFTEQGIKNIKDTQKRADAFKAMAKKKGVTVHTLLWTLGPHTRQRFCGC